VAHPVHQLAEGGACLAGQHVAGVPQIMDVDAGQAHGLGGVGPEAREVAAAQRAALGAGEDRAVIAGPGELGQVLDDIGDQEGRDARANISSRAVPRDPWCCVSLDSSKSALIRCATAANRSRKSFVAIAADRNAASAGIQPYV